MKPRPPEFIGVDWAVQDQRLAMLNRRVERWALRAQLAILGACGLIAAFAAPVFFKNLILGLVLRSQGLLP
ncbi:MAG: hypothetical protein BGO57_13295 [Sphingomonadales bacterium 63-6]|nr:MAG: hypothetical protein BGO57_13295 [Sphingomonadales bacterium 63-6]